MCWPSGRVQSWDCWLPKDTSTTSTPLTARGQLYERPLLIGHASGGVARVSKTKALDTLESGPAMGVLGAAYYARQLKQPRLIALDAGGTTVKVSAIQDGRPVLAREGEVFG